MLILGSFMVVALSTFFVFVCLFMMLVILIQKPKGGGLTGAFGGAGGAVQTAFGSKVGDLLTWITVVCFVIFLLLAMGLTWQIQADLPVPKPRNAVKSAPASPLVPAGEPVTPTPEKP